MNIYCLAFDDFETLDYMGVVEMLSHIPDIRLHYVSLRGGPIRSYQGFEMVTQAMPEQLRPDDVLLVVGGMGTRSLVNDHAFIARLGQWADEAAWVLSVCTGSALLAKTGRLDDRRATSNKKAMAWVMSQGPNVHWQTQARWVRDSKFYTSSGVSAGMDMALQFMADQFGTDMAQEAANFCEYHWQQDAGHDAFARLYGY